MTDRSSICGAQSCLHFHPREVGSRGRFFHYFGENAGGVLELPMWVFRKLVHVTPMRPTCVLFNIAESNMLVICLSAIAEKN